jgi:DNA uptake protein ComE-like DNA-binding protein
LASRSELLALGLDSQVAGRIVNYRIKGGKFKKPADLLKIYSMDSAWYDRVSDSILIPSQEKKPSTSPKKIKPSFFDPNTVTREKLLKMNLRPTLVNSWMKFLERGGSFSSCDDLKKLYVLKESEYAQLRSFCVIEKMEEERPIIYINAADSITLLLVNGVGPAYAHRIMEYRNRLGGFVVLEQLLEVYGMDSSRFDQISSQVKLDSIALIRLNVNQDDFKVLLKHPYLNYEQVKSIVNYRDNMGHLNNVNELLELEGFSEEDLARLNPYLTF